ncbi:copper-binding protein [Leucothrix pacifica]|uniref:Copper-binding protein n=2 Tax=Leucothrix pacifica TaxID=1247513 RepID=A0A317C8E2_9GAMM|nr:copper-binding protein [Leucothrix pacifica]
MEGHEGHKMSAVGMPAAKGAVPNKTITVHMMDTMKYNFSNLAGIEEGDIVKFVVMNKGKIPHEFGIGSIEEQVAHRKMMKEMPNMKHEDGSTVSVEPGKSKELIWQFIGDETAQFACNVPGHFEAGMHAEVELH